MRVALIAHIPLLRIDAEVIEYADGQLWRLPFEAFNAWTLGAWEDHRARYDETAPVVYRVVADLPLDSPAEQKRAEGVAELKMPSDRWAMLQDLGLGYVTAFHDRIVDPAWVALLLAAPAGAFPPPRWSATFVVPDDDEDLPFNSGTVRAARVQGDADLEYFFLPESASPPLAADVIAEANARYQALETLTRDPELAAAIRALAGAASPSLSPAEQLTLTVMALESLLLPEVRSGLGSTFARRIASLLGADESHRADLQRHARVLYDARSAALHGEEPRSVEAAATAANTAASQQLLSSAITTLASRMTSGASLAELRELLDSGGIARDADSVVRIPVAAPAGLRAPERLQHMRIARTGVVSDQGMEAPAGVMLTWVPLIGLACDDTFRLDAEPVVMLLQMTGAELVSMEEKDVRRDFPAQLQVQAHPIACMTTGARAATEEEAIEQMDVLNRRRDLAVVALRLAGLDAFHDPELLGTFLFHHRIRYRRPSVLRQTLMLELRTEPTQRLTAADEPRLTELWRTLLLYDTAHRCEEIDQVLRSFRRVFDRRFLLAASRATLMIALLESMLGRFAHPREKVQLSGLVENVLGDSEAVRWFAEQGRNYRNAVAHGSVEPEAGDPGLIHLVAILRGLLPQYLDAWMLRTTMAEERPMIVFRRAAQRRPGELA